MTPQEKPEWFEISENDSSSNVRPISKRIPVLALVATALILGVGAVVAQTQEESPASAVEATTTVPAITDQPQVDSGTSATAPNAPSLTAPKITTPNAPSIAKPPAGRGGDDDDEFGEHEGREHRERGEHGGFGDDD